ncbi:MAG: hypothetical protein QG657_1654 [Acidobacteriota bacterium]|nr:hypothetical protein [Acidobacteriota bacterium]
MHKRIDIKRLVGSDGIILIIILLLSFPTWVREGAIRQFLAPYPWLAAITLFVFLLTPYLRRTSHSHGCLLVRQQVQSILRDPIFYLGAAFLCQLYIQWWNSGKVRIFEQMEGGAQNVMFSPPYIDWLPGAVDSILSWDMVVRFFPTFVALLIIRHAFSRLRMVRILFWGMVINASLLAIFGMIAPFLTKNYPTWLIPILPRQPVFFFSTFGYPNHAGSFFILHLGLACGLFFYYYINRKEEPRASMKAGILSVIILLQFCAIHLSRGRYAILFSWIMAAAFMLYLLHLTPWKNFKVRRKTSFIAIATTCVVVIGSLALYITSKDEIRARLSTMAKPGKFIAEQFDMKFWQIVAAAKIWKDHPLWESAGIATGNTSCNT